MYSHTDTWAEGKLEWEGLLQESTKILKFYLFLFKTEIMACLQEPYVIEQYHNFQANRERGQMLMAPETQTCFKGLVSERGLLKR